MHLFPAVLLGEKAVTLLSNGNGSLLSGGLVANSNNVLKFEFMDLRD